MATKADLASPTFTGTVTLPGLEIQDTSSDHQYVFAVNELTADRTVTLPLLTGNDTFTFNAFAATLTNKTIDLTDNTVSGTFAEFNTACSDATFVSLTGSETLTNKTLTSPTLTTPALGTPASGTLTNCTGLPISGITSTTSASLASIMSDETGSGSLVFATSPTLVTPALGTPSAAVLTNATGLPLSTGVTGTLPVANGGTGSSTALNAAIALGVPVRLASGETAANTTAITFDDSTTGVFDGTFRKYRVEFYDINFEGADNLRMVCETTAGWETSSGDYMRLRSRNTSDTAWGVSHNNSSGYIELSESMEDNANETGVSGFVEIYNAEATQFTKVVAQLSGHRYANGKTAQQIITTGACTVALALRGIRFEGSGANNWELGGRFVLYGMDPV